MNGMTGFRCPPARFSGSHWSFRAASVAKISPGSISVGPATPVSAETIMI
jgi:hypothetical protein